LSGAKERVQGRGYLAQFSGAPVPRPCSGPHNNPKVEFIIEDLGSGAGDLSYSSQVVLESPSYGSWHPSYGCGLAPAQNQQLSWEELLNTPRAYEKVAFGVLNLEKAELLVGVDGEVYKLEPKQIVKIPLVNALILEQKWRIGKILWTPDDAVLFKMHVKGIDPNNFSRATGGDEEILRGDGRKPVHVQYSNALDTDTSRGWTFSTSQNIMSNSTQRVRFINSPYDLLIGEVIYSENYTSIKPARRLVELAVRLGFKEYEFEASITDYFHYRCESNGHIVHIPKVEGGRLNPFRLQQNSRNSAKALAKKLVQLNREAKVLERDSRTGELRLLGRNNLYLIPMELTYPHELNDYFLKLIKENPKKFEQLRERAVEIFFKKVLEYEFGEYAKFSDFIYWISHHDWKTDNPTAEPHFHEHINLLNVLFDWTGSEDYIKLYEAINKYLTPTTKDIAEYTGWSIPTVKRKISFFRGMNLIHYSRRGRFFTATEPPLPTPLIRFNPLRFVAEEVKRDEKRLEAYQRFWKEAIEEVFKVKVKSEVVVVHLPDKVISLENFHELVHRLSYCSRKPIVDLNNYFSAHPNADIGLDWLNHLLNLRTKLKPNKIARRLSIYVGIEFLATLQNRLSRLRRKYESELRELECVVYERADKEIELKNARDFNLLHLEAVERLKNEIEQLKAREDELRQILRPYFELEEKVKQLSESLEFKPICPLCGSEMRRIHDIEISPNALHLYWDSVARKWVLEGGG